jgi:CRISPR-associated protein Cas1
MVVLYLTQQGASLRKKSRCLVVEQEGETLAEVPIIKVERVAVFGNVSLTTPAINLLLDEGIDVAFLSCHAELRGRLVGRLSKNVYQRRRRESPV